MCVCVCLVFVCVCVCVCVCACAPRNLEEAVKTNKIDWGEKIGNLDLTSSFNGHQVHNMCSNIYFQSKVEVFEGHAKFDENGVCHVGDHQIAADHTLIATGGHPIVPDLPGEIGP